MAGNALVVGGGIGGLAAAVALAQRGAAVTLVEQAAEISEVGAGLQISPNGLAVLRALGVAPWLDRMGAVAATAVELRDYRAGRLVARLDLTRHKDRRYLFVHRADLVSGLLRAAREANVSIELGRRVTDVQPGAVSRVAFADGGQARSELLVCADGIRSAGRAAVNGATEAKFTGQVAWRATVPASAPPPVVQVFMGPGRHAVCYPLRGGRLMNVVAVEERDAWAEEGWHHQDDPEALRHAFSAFGTPLQALLAQVETVHLWGLFRHPVARTWVRDGTVLLGDAAHPTLPFLAQGANMALEDAWVLADVVARGAPLSDYARRRRQRAERIVAAATGNAWKYHLHPGPLRWGAHTALRLGSRLAPGLMLRPFDWLYGHDVTQKSAGG